MCDCNKKDEYLEGMLNKYEPKKDNLIQILNNAQEHYGYIPEYVQKAISEYLKMPMAEIYGVITFYSRFTLEPKGKYVISICMGTACFVTGAEKLVERVKERLKVESGKTTDDGMFSLDETRCIGACGIAPVYTVNDEVHGKATVQQLDKVLDELLEKAKTEEGGN